MTTRIRTTCTHCGVGLEAPARRVLVDLPSATDGETPPLLLLHCPACGQASGTALSWPHAAYLLAGGAGCVVSPDLTDVAPVYPEQRPVSDEPLTLDALIDLHAELDHGLAIR